MSIDPLDRPHDRQPVPGQGQNPSQSPDFVTDNPDVQGVPGEPSRRPGTGPDVQDPGTPDDDPTRPGLGNPIP